jgi:16S rRNA (cytosine967-C5)-methyltransferase
VLVDAPCSSSGTWRRKPDGKYRLTSNDLAELTALQLSILEKAAHAVRTDGLLIYATCSFIADENESVVEAFLKNNESFSLVQASMHGNPFLDSDATFTAVMKRK